MPYRLAVKTKDLDHYKERHRRSSIPGSHVTFQSPPHLTEKRDNFPRLEALNAYHADFTTSTDDAGTPKMQQFDAAVLAARHPVRHDALHHIAACCVQQARGMPWCGIKRSITRPNAYVHHIVRDVLTISGGPFPPGSTFYLSTWGSIIARCTRLLSQLAEPSSLPRTMEVHWEWEGNGVFERER